MALLQPPKTLQITANLFPISNFSSIRPSISIPFSSSSKTLQQNALLSSSTTTPRRILCKPPKGKYIHDDYLVKKMTAEEVQELVKGKRNVPLIIDFYATWCGPCILMAQELEMLAVEYENNAMIIKVDTDDEYEFSRDMLVKIHNPFSLSSLLGFYTTKRSYTKHSHLYDLQTHQLSANRVVKDIVFVRMKGKSELDALFQVRGLPTLFFISPDPKKEAIRTEGLIPIQMMRDIIDKEM